LSPTSIDRWRQCPRRFLYQDIERRPFEDTKTYEQTLGEVVHATLEWLVRAVDADKRDEPALIRSLDKSLSRLASTGQLSAADSSRMRAEALDMLLGYVRSGALSDVNALKVETTFQLRLRNGAAIHTRIDRVDTTESHQLHIVDYKSGRYQIEADELSKETPAIVQLLAVTEASDIPVERVSWVYLRTGETISWWPELQDVEFAAERLKKVLRRMHLDREYLPNAGPHCVGCPFRAVCPVSASASPSEMPQAA